MKRFRMINNKEVLHIIDNIGLGGAQRVVYDLVEGSGYKVATLNAREEELNTSNLDFVQLGNLNKFNISSIKKLLKYIRDNEIKILHTHLFKSFLSGLIVKIALGNKIRLFVHDHGEILNPTGFLRRTIYRGSLVFSRLFVERYIVVSEYSASRIAPFVGDKNVRVLYNPISDTYFNYEKIKKRDNIFRIGFAGRLTLYKGILELIEAFNLLNDIHPNTKLLIAGAGPMRDDVISASNKNGNIESKGFVKDMKAFYAGLDLFVNPSHYEAMGLTHIEAMACGVPVLVSNAPAMNLMLKEGENSFFFDTGNVEDLTGKIKYLLENSDIRNKVVNNGLEFIKKFKLEKYLIDLENIYEEN